jgi:hypothetical protein
VGESPVQQAFVFEFCPDDTLEFAELPVPILSFVNN